MLPRLPGTFALAVLLAVTPAALRWWWGRSLSLLIDDPLLPERLAAHNRRFGAVSGGCAALLVMGWPMWAVWNVPLLIVAQAIGGFPLRKTLYQETWKLGACLSFFGRLAAAVFGFWIVLAVTPWLASLAGRFDWVAGGTLAMVLVGWNRYSEAALRALLRSRPITDPATIARFEALVSAAGLPMPRFEYVPMRGGVLANAVAVPSLRRSSVIFTETLLSRLPEDEITAICAHELAHLEYYDRARLRRLNAVTLLLIAGAAATAPISRLVTGSPALGAVALIWPGALMVALFLRARHRQQNETVSDLRAVALTGDAEALARALTTLHAVARVPRRWDLKREQQATHPSLARRIRDIRNASGVAVAPLDAPASFRAATGGAVVTFEQARLCWQEAPGTTHVLDYGALVELRLDATASGAVTLVAAERQGRRWRMTPATMDLPALQGVLDVVDGRLTHDTRVAGFPSAVPRLVACLGWVLAFLLGQIALAFVAMLASLSPARSLLNGAGAAALAAAVIMMRDGAFASRSPMGAAVIVAALGAGLLALGWTRRGESTRGEASMLGVLGVCGALAFAWIGLNGLDPIRLHQGARSAPAAPVLLAALAAASWTSRKRRGLRYVAFAATVAAASAGVAGSTTFLDRVGRDPFLVAAAPVTWTAMDAPALMEFDLPFNAEELRLSPRGSLAALVRADDEERNGKPAPAAFLVGHAGGALVPLEATDLAFIDEHRALLLVVHDGAAEVRDLGLDAAPVILWRVGIPDIRWGTLTYQRVSNRWTMIGRDGAGRFVRATGTVGDGGVQRTSWRSPSTNGGWIDAVEARDAALFAVEKRYAASIVRWTPLLTMAPWLVSPLSQSQLWRLQGEQRADAGRSRLDASCVSGALTDRLVCSAFDGIRTRIVAIDPQDGSVAGLAMLNGHFRADSTAAPGWLTGWRDSTPIALRLATREAIRPPGRPHEFVQIVTTTETVIGTVSWSEGGSRVHLYPLPGPLQTVVR